MIEKAIKIFIGSGEQSLLERKVLIYSLRKHTQRKLDIYVFNGTHNAIERNDKTPILAPMSLRIKYQNATEFSLYRYLIPELCSYEGRAIYLDSDMVCLDDIGKLYDIPLHDFDFLARRGAFDQPEDKTFGLSAMLINCAKCRFDLEKIYNEIDQGLYTYQDFARMGPAFRTHHAYHIGEMNQHWNTFDHCDTETQIIHYTNLYTQPWKYSNHPYGEIWFQYFTEALQKGDITDDDIHLTIIRGYARRDLLKGNLLDPKPKRIFNKRLKHAFRKIKKFTYTYLTPSKNIPS